MMLPVWIGLGVLFGGIFVALTLVLLMLGEMLIARTEVENC
ncbi:MAG: hypothetical protein SPL39_11900 [Selenomonadaceae bacterium]|nr:hypothetical protein [Selenomonadaceae bacterium]